MTHAERNKNPNPKTTFHDAYIINWVTQPRYSHTESFKCFRQGQLAWRAPSIPDSPCLFMAGLFYN